MSADLFQSYLNLHNPELPENFKTDHFSNAELKVLKNAFSYGNVLEKPESIGDLAEYIYKFDSDVEAFKDSGIQQMWRDGLGSFLVTACNMIDGKKPGFIRRE